VLLGLDDGVSRACAARGDDLVLADPHVGDRDARTEDRQALLDALLAARDTLVVHLLGERRADERAAPPAEPVGELLNVVVPDGPVDDGGGEGARARDGVRRAPSAPAVSTRGTSAVAGTGAVLDFDRAALDGARALSAGDRPAPPPFLPALDPVARTCSPSTTSCASSATPRRRSCATASTSGWAGLTTSSPTRSPSS
jgi:exodeoxyribonuclease V gamma subunit